MSKQYSSCSTIYLDDSTVSQPNLRNTLKAVALAIYFHIKNRENRTASELEGRLLDIFDEKLHPLTVFMLPTLTVHKLLASSAAISSPTVAYCICSGRYVVCFVKRHRD